MTKSPAVFLLVSSLTLVAPMSARAAGLITALTASANPVNVNTDLTFTVKGTGGGCGDITIDFGDGQTTQLLSVSFNNNTNTTTPPHKYAAAKAYVVKAIPGKSCTGAASVNLTVTAPASGGGGGTPSNGRFLSNPLRLRSNVVGRFLAPQITSVFPFSVIQPGGGVIVQGANFGATPGEFKLHLQSGLDTDLGNLTWQNDAVSGIIDPGITGVLDQPATLRVIDSRGTVSEEAPVKFTARREIRLLPKTDWQVDCSQHAGRNSCNAGQYPNMVFSITGYHTCDPDVVSDILGCDSNGTDDFTLSYSPGWQYDHSDLHVQWGHAGPIAVQTDDPGSTHLSVHWDDTGESADYWASVYVIGPVGTAYR